MRSTHTYAELEVPAELYDVVRDKLVEADCMHAFESGAFRNRKPGQMDVGPIDMHGIALTRGPREVTAAHLADEAYRHFVEAFYPSWRRMMDGKAKFAVMRLGAQPITKADIEQARAENLDAPQLLDAAPDYKPTEPLELCSADFLAQVETDLRRSSLSPGTRRFLEAGSAARPALSAERGDDDCRNGNTQPQANTGEGETMRSHLSGGEPWPGYDSGVRRPPTNPLPPVDFGAIVTKNL